MKIKKGDKLEEITLPTHEGVEFNLSQTSGACFGCPQT